MSSKQKNNESIKQLNSKSKSKTFDTDKFNREFIYKRDKAKLQTEIKSKEKLDKLNKEANEELRPLYSLSLSEIFIGIKDTWFDILDDLLALNINSNLITKNNRLFYIGITIIIIAVLFYLYNFFIEEK